MAHKGTSTFVLQRASAVVLIPLSLWFLLKVVPLLGADYQTAHAWALQPVNAVLLALFLVISAFHMRIGLEEIVVDYIHSWLKTVLILLSWLAAIALMALAIWSAYQLSFAG